MSQQSSIISKTDFIRGSLHTSAEQAHSGGSTAAKLTLHCTCMHSQLPSTGHMQPGCRTLGCSASPLTPSLHPPLHSCLQPPFLPPFLPSPNSLGRLAGIGRTAAACAGGNVEQHLSGTQGRAQTERCSSREWPDRHKRLALGICSRLWKKLTPSNVKSLRS